MQAHSDARAAREQRVQVEGAYGVERTRVRTATRQLETLFGTVEIGRQFYQAPGSEGLAIGSVQMEALALGSVRRVKTWGEMAADLAEST